MIPSLLDAGLVFGVFVFGLVAGGMAVGLFALYLQRRRAGSGRRGP